MRGKSSVKKRKIQPDPIYNSALVSKFINLVMLNGKKNLARKVVYTTLEELSKEHNKSPLEIFDLVLDKARPTAVLKARRVGGSNFQVPLAVERDKGIIIAMRWILEVARKRKGAPIIKDLIKEMNDILSDQGDVLKKKDDTHRMAEANRAFSHFR